MIKPLQAAVRPRVRIDSTSEIVLLEDLVSEHLAAGQVRIDIHGAAGSGKTTALQHLAHQFVRETALMLTDDLLCHGFLGQERVAVILIRPELRPQGHLIRCRLAGWQRDEWIEYLLAVHKDHCASVMQRLRDDSDCDVIDGNANLWRLLLDELASDEQLATVQSALERIVFRTFPDDQVRHALAWTSYLALLPAVARRDDPRAHASSALTVEQERLGKSRAVQLILATEAATWDLEHSNLTETLRFRWPDRLVDNVSHAVAKSSWIQDRIRSVLVPKHRDVHSLAASLLHASGIGWKPESSRLLGLRTGWLNFKEASLAHADWPRIDLSGCVLKATDFSNANLAEAKLCRVNAWRAVFDDANLHRAKMSRFEGHTASFVGANLTSIRGRKVTLEGANLSFADLTDALLIRSNLKGVNFSEAIVCGACLKEVDLKNSVIDGTDFTGADFDLAKLAGLDLTVACFLEARFVNADLHGCNLENMKLPAANFSQADLSKALLTGSMMPNANFSGADLREAGLAEIDWEFADLRGADLSGVTFHMGSTRDGLVGSTIPMHGSRTGFYTDDFIEQDFKSPEEIRKANLRGADLRGAKIGNVDFYLVDLRDALYDGSQEEHFRKCGAILESRER